MKQKKLLLEPTATAQWKKALKYAKQQSQCQLHEDIEAYLIFTLIRFTREPALASIPLGPELLNCNKLYGKDRESRLRDVGDHCLLLSGLFPQRAEKRLVQAGYYVDLGMTAYQFLSDQLKRSFADLYQMLSRDFVNIMDVLQNIYTTERLNPLQAIELWQHSGSRSAKQIITSTSSATPVLINQDIRH